MKTTTPGALLARLRWSKPDADRDQPRRAGKLGGRPPSCACGECAKCKRRAKRQAAKGASE